MANPEKQSPSPGQQIPAPNRRHGRISVLCAFFNEELTLPELRRRLEQVARDLEPDHELEFVLIDDHSSDAGPALVRAWAEEDSRVRVIRLSRNCGSHAAYAAGLAAATGDAAVLLAADLQDPPEFLHRLLASWKAGYDVVWASRAAREGIAWSARMTAGLYYRLMSRCALPNMPRGGADFVLLDRSVVRAYLAIPEKHTSLLGMLLWLGFRQTELPCVKAARFAGRSKWSLSRKIKLFVDSLVSFSTIPVRIVGVLAATAVLATLGLAAFLAVRGLAGHPTSGWSCVVLAVLAVGAAQLVALTVLAEYIWRMFDQVRGRPRYVVEEDSKNTEPAAATSCDLAA